MIREGDTFMHHDAGGTRGPYVVQEIHGGTWVSLRREGSSQLAWALLRRLSNDKPVLDRRGYGWEYVETRF